MKYVWIIFALLLTCKVQAQVMQPKSLDKEEQYTLNLFWKKFKKAFFTKNSDYIYSRSLSMVDCIMLKKDDEKTSFMSIKAFTNRFYKEFTGTKIWSVLKNKQYRLGAEKALNYKAPNIKHQRSKSLLIYEIWYTAWEPGEYDKSSEGMSVAFEFVKIGSNLKFYGITSIP